MRVKKQLDFQKFALLCTDVIKLKLGRVEWGVRDKLPDMAAYSKEPQSCRQGVQPGWCDARRCRKSSKSAHTFASRQPGVWEQNETEQQLQGPGGVLRSTASSWPGQAWPESESESKPGFLTGSEDLSVYEPRIALEGTHKEIQGSQ